MWCSFFVKQVLCEDVSNCCYCTIDGVCELFSYTISLGPLVDVLQKEDKRNQYFVTVEVVNNALLVTTKHFDIFVGSWFPKTGVTFESKIFFL